MSARALTCRAAAARRRDVGPAAGAAALFQSSVTYADARLAGLDAAVLMEVIEHVDPPRLPALGAGRLRRGAAGGCRRDDAELRAQRAVRVASGRRFPAPGSPVRVDAGGVPRWAEEVCVRTGTGDVPRGRSRTTRRSGRRRSSRCSGKESVCGDDRRTGAQPRRSGRCRAGRASRRSRASTSSATEVISSDFCRGLVSDDENDQAATKDAFEVLHFIAAKRLAAGRLTVIDATNVQPEARASWSRWRGSTTYCRWRSCSTCRSRWRGAERAAT